MSPVLRISWSAALAASLSASLPVRGEILPAVPMHREPVTLGEDLGAGRFDHTAFDALLKEYVNEKGEVNVSALNRNRKVLSTYLEEVGAVRLKDLSRHEQAALLINTYNARTLLELIDRPAAKTIADWPGGPRDITVRVAGHSVSLYELEHLMLRTSYADSRMPFVLARGARGDSGYPGAALTGATLNAQLSAQARRFFADSSRCRWDADAAILRVSGLVSRYGADLGASEASRKNFILDHLPPGLQAELRKRGPAWELGTLPFDPEVVRAAEVKATGAPAPNSAGAPRPPSPR